MAGGKPSLVVTYAGRGVGMRLHKECEAVEGRKVGDSEAGAEGT
jgi:hypothetical protein